MSDGNLTPEPAGLAGWAALNTDEQRENIVWRDTPGLPSQLPQALGELRLRLERNALNPWDF